MDKHTFITLATVLLLTGAGSLSYAYAAPSGAGDSPSMQQDKMTVKGIVLDEKGLPVIGASVVSGDAFTVTDLDGSYAVNVPVDAVITFSFVGYLTQEVQVNGKAKIDVTLIEDVALLEDVVVVGYGVQKKATLTGSISAVNGDELKKVSVANLTNTLAGKTAGVIANNRSGEPGADDADILIRGKGTTGDTSPLIVVDGIAGRDFSRLNPEDIESISILKDASAAIYGARAANGVILVTTKRGTKGKVTLDYNGSYTMSQPTRVPQMLDAVQYATYINEYDLQSRHGRPGVTFSEEDIAHYKSGDDPIGHPNTDWWDEVAKNWSSKTQHSISVSGGSDKVNFYVSGQYMYQDGLYKKSAQNYKQYQFVSNLDAKITKSIRFSLDVLGRQEDRNYGPRSTDDIYTYFLTTFPGSAPYYPNGLPRVGYDGLTNNAAVMVTDAGGYTKNIGKTLTVKPFLRIDLDVITKGLYAEGYAAIDLYFNNSNSLYRPFDLYSYDSTTGEYTNRKDDTSKISVDNSNTNTSSYTLNGKIGYDRIFGGNHHVNAFVAYEQNQYNYHYFTAGRTNYISETIPELFAGSDVPEDISNTGYSTASSRVNFFGRANYSYKDKYLFEATFRYDGSMNFAPGKRWGFFPSFSAGWVMSEENFWKPVAEKISFFKLKASWGQMGNDNVAAYQYMAQYMFEDAENNPYFGTGDAAQAYKAFYLARVANPDITWEVANTFNVGLTMSFLKYFTFDADYFFSKRSNILCTRNASIPWYSGLTLPDENIGKVNNQGVEAMLSYRQSSGDWSWGISGNITYARNKVVYMDEAEDTPEWQRQEGHPIDSQLLYDAIGIYQTQAEIDASPHVDGAEPGDLQYADTDGDGQITSNDMIRVDYTRTPRLVYGFTLSGAWKGLDLNLFFQGQGLAKQTFYPTVNMVTDFYEGRWVDSDVSTHENARWPKALIAQTYMDEWNGKYSTWWLRNCSFLRLKSAELGYTLPQKWMDRIHVERLRFYVSGTNLFTIDSFKVADPEVGSLTSYPLQRMVNFGLNLTF